MKFRQFYEMNGDMPVLMTNYFCAICDVEMNHLYPVFFVDEDCYCGDCAFKGGLINEERYVRDNCYWYFGGNPKRVGAYVDEDGRIVIWDKRYKDPRTKKNKDYRHTNQYQNWRKEVFTRDNFTCAICGQVGGELNAHHIKPFKDFKKNRFDVNNGITLCVSCHRKVHKEKNSEWLHTGEQENSR